MSKDWAELSLEERRAVLEADGIAVRRELVPCKASECKNKTTHESGLCFKHKR